jgi:adenine-specific DNA-methyltransferase
MKKLYLRGLPQDWLFPTTRYRGSKRKILGWIWENICDLQFENALDLFGGTSVVSLLFKRMGKQVTYNDYSYFNSLTGLAFIQNNNVKLSDADIDLFIGEAKRNCDLISKTFKGIYFPDDENSWLDKTIGNISALADIYEGEELKYKYALAIWALGQACLIKRPFNLFHIKNLHLRTSRVEIKFGNKTTWETPFEAAFKRFAIEANQIVFDNNKLNYSTRVNALSYEKVDYDLVYLDPPYFFKNQKDPEYLRLYHFLDGLAQYNTWHELIDITSPIKPLTLTETPWPHTSVDKLESIFSKLISKFKKGKIVISHKEGSLITVDKFQEMLMANDKKCAVFRKQYSYALNHQNGKSHENNECLIIGV